MLVWCSTWRYDTNTFDTIYPDGTLDTDCWFLIVRSHVGIDTNITEIPHFVSVFHGGPWRLQSFSLVVRHRVKMYRYSRGGPTVVQCSLFYAQGGRAGGWVSQSHLQHEPPWLAVFRQLCRPNSSLRIRAFGMHAWLAIAYPGSTLSLSIRTFPLFPKHLSKRPERASECVGDRPHNIRAALGLGWVELRRYYSVVKTKTFWLIGGTLLFEKEIITLVSRYLML